jgi:hypothetical protein
LSTVKSAAGNLVSVLLLSCGHFANIFSQAAQSVPRVAELRLLGICPHAALQHLRFQLCVHPSQLLSLSR